ncbi:MAG: hypothetical protein H6709_20745 [Kofleriaceae bacterium]|nr:hypothetical protein [Kofleriaceae bacterium]MCB9574512.1 hypothetical protein [Kofleriaceae bacterium]
MTHGFRDDRVRERAKQTLAPAHAAELLDRRQARLLAAALGCLDGACRFILVGPLTGIGPSLGTLRVAGQRELPRAAVDSLNAICAQASVRLAHLGFTTDDAGRGLGGLTPRQRDVARLVARGYTNAEIAQALRVTENAVKKHLKLILATLDLCNRAELAAVTSRALATLDHLDATRLAPGFQLIELPPLSGTSPRRREGRP